MITTESDTKKSIMNQTSRTDATSAWDLERMFQVEFALHHNEESFDKSRQCVFLDIWFILALITWRQNTESISGTSE